MAPDTRHGRRQVMRRRYGPVPAAIVCGFVLAGAAGAEDRPQRPAGDSSPAALEITYVGNEGFLIAGGGKKILVDALFRNGVDGYVVLPERRRKLLESARAPFDGVDLILATHEHADHFDAAAVGEHLRNNPGAFFVSTRQAVDRLRSTSAGFEPIRERVLAIVPPEGQRVRKLVNGIDLQILYLHHGRGRPTQNLGFLIRLNGRTLLHIGDTEATREDFAVYDLPAERIDIGFIPYWYLISPEWKPAVRSAIASEQIIVMHVPPRGTQADHIVELGGWDGMLDGIEREFREASVFRIEMETRRFR